MSPNAAREQFNNVSVALQQQSTVQTQQVVQNMRMAFGADGAAIYKPVSTVTSPTYGEGSALGSGGGGGGGEQMKRKRGRPRKYGPDGTMAMAFVPGSQQSLTPTQSTGGGSTAAFSPSSPHPGAAAPPPPPPPEGAVSPTPMKKARGRPPGSGKKNRLDALGLAGISFTPHVIIVKAGEDVSSKIMSFSQHGPRAVCILSANGAISNVTIRQAATSGGTVTYEGRFEILSLSGTFTLSENAGQRSRIGGLSVCLSGPDGRVLGGGVAGLLTAASPVQVVVATFFAGKESKAANPVVEPLSATRMIPTIPTAGAPGAGSPPSRGTLSESSGGPGSPLNQSTGACNNSNSQGISGIPWK